MLPEPFDKLGVDGNSTLLDGACGGTKKAMTSDQITSTMGFTSTGALIGSEATPTDEQACVPSS